MGNTKSFNLFKLLGFIIVLLFIGVTVRAQDSTMSTWPNSKVQNPPSQGQTSTPQGQMPSSQDLSFNTSASQLSNELIQQTGISTDNAARITQILVSYRNDLAAARNKYYENNPNASKNQDVTGSSQTNVDMNGILGDNVDQYYKGIDSDLLSDFKDADKKADNKIQDVFDNDVQKSRYDQVKSQWWKDVKDKVFPSLTQNSQNQMK
ncbi:MAG: hypothetical protein Q8933_20630 [Bacteroidota bacterium]|nr:hypothetical protein [Bacteroidota bacterium]MDP4197694.1 hypothetical protein [Bacteroidota bacterium]